MTRISVAMLVLVSACSVAPAGGPEPLVYPDSVYREQYQRHVEAIRRHHRQFDQIRAHQRSARSD